MVSNWFGPKVKGTAMSIAMLGSGAGALVWIWVVTAVIASSGWRAGFLAMAAINALLIPIALIFVVSMPIDKGFETRVGDPSPEESAGASSVPAQSAGITGRQALTTARWWCQFGAGMVTMIGASAFSYYCVDYFTLVTGSSDTASTIYAGALPSVIPFLITLRNFGDKEYGIMSGWMNIAGNIGQIIGPTTAALVFDTTGNYVVAWVAFAVLMVVVAVLYFLSNVVSKKQIEAMGYPPE